MKSLLKNQLANLNETWHKAFLQEGNTICANEGPLLFRSGDNNKKVKIFRHLKMSSWPIGSIMTKPGEFLKIKTI